MAKSRGLATNATELRRGAADGLTMAEINSRPLLATDTVAVWDVLCSGTCRHKSDEECLTTTHLVFPYRGIFVHHMGQAETVAEANQVVFFNESEPYRVSHPVEGGDASLSIGIDEQTLLELVPADFLRTKGRTLFNRPRMRIDARAQLLAALVRHRLARGMTETFRSGGFDLFAGKPRPREAHIVRRIRQRRAAKTGGPR